MAYMGDIGYRAPDENYQPTPAELAESIRTAAAMNEVARQANQMLAEERNDPLNALGNAISNVGKGIGNALDLTPVLLIGGGLIFLLVIMRK